MGQEILYCTGCSAQLRSAHFEKRLAFKVNAVAWCLQCAQKKFPSITPPEAEITEEPVKPSSNARQPLPQTTPGGHSLPIPNQGSSRQWLLMGGVAALLAIGIGITTLSRRGTVTVKDPVLPGPAREIPVPLVSLPGQAPQPAKEPALVRLDKARAWDRWHPGDYSGRIALWQEALKSAPGSPLEKTAKEGLEEVTKAERQAAQTELGRSTREALDREDFGYAVQSLESSKERYSDPGWKAWIEESIAGARDRSRKSFAPLKEQVEAAVLKGMPGEVNGVREKVKGWGTPELLAELDRILEEAPKPPAPPPEPPPTAASAALKAYSAAADKAAGRRYEEAIQGLVQVGLVKESEILKAAAALLRGGLDTFSRTPKGTSLSFHFLDPQGSPQSLSGEIVRIDAFRVEIKGAEGTKSVPIGEIAPVDVLASATRSGGKGQDAQSVRALLVLEGWETESQDPAAPPKPALPEELVRQAGIQAERRQSPREMEARKLLWQTEADSEHGLLSPASILRSSKLVREYSDCAVVGRNREMLSKAMDLGREYVYFRDDFRKSGAFARVQSKSGNYLLSESDSPPERRLENFVEMEFGVLPETTYRCWAYIGGCCAETFAFAVQGTGVVGPSGPCEPGSEGLLPVKHSLGSVLRTHAAHGGKKQPSRWGWAEIPLPRCEPGMKSLRIVSDQQGFAVSAVLISSSRQAPPGEGDFKKLSAVKPEVLLRAVGPMPDAWWDFDTLSGKAFANRTGPTLAAPFRDGVSTSPGGLRGQAVAFQGIAGLRADPGALLNSPDITVAFWVRPTVLRGRFGLLSSRTDQNPAPFIVTQQDAGIRFECADEGGGWSYSFGAEGGLKENGWTHVAVILKAGVGGTILIDGKVAAEKKTPTKRNSGSQGIILGSETWGGDPPNGATPGHFKGLMDEVKIWAKALRPEEIEADFLRR